MMDAHPEPRSGGAQPGRPEPPAREQRAWAGLLGPLGQQTTRATAGAGGALVALALVSSSVRLLPWLLDPRVPWAATAVFARGLFSVGLETACYLALPLGHALAASAFNDRGEGLACQLAGAAPSGLAARLLPLSLAIALLGGCASLAWGGETARPGRALGELVEAARGACDAERRPVADVPGTGASWLCFHEEPPLLATLSGDGALATAREVRVSDDLAEVRLDGLRLSLRGPPELHIEVGEARVTGTDPLARSAHAAFPGGAPPWLRALSGSLASLLGALACTAALLRSLDARRLVALALGAASGLGPLWLLGALDRAAGALASLPPGSAPLLHRALPSAHLLPLLPLLHLSVPLAALAPSLAYLALRAAGGRAARARGAG
jgi:hypothetical protein